MRNTFHILLLAILLSSAPSCSDLTSSIAPQEYEGTPTGSCTDFSGEDFKIPDCPEPDARFGDPGVSFPDEETNTSSGMIQGWWGSDEVPVSDTRMKQVWVAQGKDLVLNGFHFIYGEDREREFGYELSVVLNDEHTVPFAVVDSHNPEEMPYYEEASKLPDSEFAPSQIVTYENYKQRNLVIVVREEALGPIGSKPVRVIMTPTDGHLRNTDTHAGFLLHYGDDDWSYEARTSTEGDQVEWGREQLIGLYSTRGALLEAKQKAGESEDGLQTTKGRTLYGHLMARDGISSSTKGPTSVLLLGPDGLVDSVVFEPNLSSSDLPRADAGEVVQARAIRFELPQDAEGRYFFAYFSDLSDFTRSSGGGFSSSVVVVE
jgi:hypothetical protein